MLKLLADENIAFPVIEALRQAGFDVESVASTMQGATDLDVIGYTIRLDAILVTSDTDFGEHVVRNRHPVRGMVLLELDRLPLDEGVERCRSALVALSDRLAGNLAVIEPGRVRLRPLVPLPS